MNCKSLVTFFIFLLTTAGCVDVVGGGGGATWEACSDYEKHIEWLNTLHGFPSMETISLLAICFNWFLIA